MHALHEARRRWKLREHQTDVREVDERPRDALPVDRTYDQSMSGRMSSQRTAPPDSRSIATTKSPPTRCPTDIALYKYRTDVRQRLANSSRSGGVSVRKYASSFSITGILPAGKKESTPAAHLPGSKTGYDADMARVPPSDPKASQSRLYEVRRKRLRQLLEGYETATQFAEAVDESQSYISRLLQHHPKDRKNLGESKARKFEDKLGLPRGWFDIADDKQAAAMNKPAPASAWPMRTVSPQLWESLSAAEKRKAEALLLTLINGMEAERTLTKDVG